jgi:hypothetical protein
LENNLTGRWICNNDDETFYGTYYIQQNGDTLWWLGKNTKMQNDSYYTNVFKGKILNDTIEGEWSDVPLGDTMNHGELKIEIKKDIKKDNDEIILLRISASGGFGGSIWQKDYY